MPNLGRTGVLIMMNYCGFDIEPFCSDVCGDHPRPQTLAEICRNMGICCGFRAVDARDKYPGFILLPLRLQFILEAKCQIHIRQILHRSHLPNKYLYKIRNILTEHISNFAKVFYRSFISHAYIWQASLCLCYIKKPIRLEYILQVNCV